MKRHLATATLRRALVLSSSVLIACFGLATGAQAQDLTASSIVPTVNFNDTNSPGGTRNVFDMLSAESASSPCTNATTDIVMRMNPVGNSGGNMIAICSRGTNANNTMIVDPVGDINLANGAVFVDRSANRLGIGTAAPLEDLHIQNTNPSIRFEDPSVSYDLETNLDDFRIFINTNDGAGQPIGEAFTLDDGNGFFGIWNANPEAPLEVGSPTGMDALVRIENTVTIPGTGDLPMLQLINPGDQVLRFVLGAGGSGWSFDNNPNLNPAAGINSGQFRIAKIGTGVTEFSVNGFGDGRFRRNSFAVNHVNTSSRKAKTDFRPIDERTVLDQLAALPITRWRYKIEGEDKVHVGPVAEDFQEAFGLSDGSHISTVDASGVALAALKGLHQVVLEKDQKIEALEQANADLATRLERLENLLLGSSSETASGP